MFSKPKNNIVNYKKFTNLYELFKFQFKNNPDKKFVFSKINKIWTGLTFRQLKVQVDKLIFFFQVNKIKKKDRILLISTNRIEWFLFDIAIQAVGAITVPCFSTNNTSDNDFIIKDCSPKLIILENYNIYKKNETILRNKNKVIFIESHENFFSLKKILNKKHKKIIIPKIKRNDLSSIIYTSGTSGRPKGVMLSHGSILHNCEAAYHLLVDFNIQNERFLSFLPLSHSYERMAGLYFPLSIGAEIFYSESIEKVINNLTEIKPTMMTAVPRFYENVYRKLVSKFLKSNFLIKALFKCKLNALERTNLSLQEKLKIFFFNLLISKKIQNIFGGKLKTFVSGGAALSPKIGNFFLSIGVCILQGYGQTEAGPLISCNNMRNNSTKTVGAPVKDVEVMISSDKEILVKGPNLMNGYWNNKYLTKKTIKNGWLHTGDLGYLDKSKRIIINGRIKDLIITSGGDNISPNKIENLLMINPYIDQAIVYGNYKPYIIAIIVVANNFVDNSIKNVITKINQELNFNEKIRKYIISKEPFTYQNGLLTQTLKIKREKVFEKFEKEIKKLYLNK